MASTDAVRDPVPCPTKQALIEQIRDATSLMAAIQQEELEETIGGSRRQRERHAQRFREANDQRVALVDRLGQHIGEHGC